MRMLAALAFAATCTFAQHALAEGARPREACRADVERLCKGVAPGGGRIAKCMRDHRSEISPDCRASLKAARDRRKAEKAQAD